MKLFLQNFRCYTEKTFDFESETGMILLSGPSGSGKCLGKNTPVLMYDGTIQNVQDIKCNDYLMGDDSTPRLVTTICSGYETLYRIVPEKGRPYTVNSSHILSLKFDRNSYYEIKDISIQKFLSLPEKEQKRARTYHTSVNFPKNETLYSPFIVGYNLNNIFPHKFPQYEDKEISNWKSIPHEYKYNDRKSRNEFLNGLIYRCGIIENNTIVIEEKREIIRKDIEYIAFSLGFMVENKNNKIIIEGSFSEIMCVKNKIVSNYTAALQPFTIEKLQEGEYFGFELEGTNKRFLLGDFTVTHNTTVLTSLNFVLYGEGNKLITVGKTSCKVELTTKNYCISRTKRPNRVVYTNFDNKQTHEDDAAQAIINEIYGTSFDVVSYLHQNTASSFILMSPLDKLGFLERFAFSGIDIGKIKSILKNSISKRNDELVSASSRLEQATSDFAEISLPEKVDFPAKTKDKEKWIKNQNIHCKNCNTLIKRERKKITSLQEELSETKIYMIKRDNLTENINRVSKKINEDEIELQKTNYESDEKLDYYESQLAIILSQREYILEKNRYEEDKKRLEIMEKEETERLNKTIKDYKEKLWIDYTEEEAEEILKENKEILKDSEKLEYLKNRMNQYLNLVNDVEIQKEELNNLENELLVKKNLQSKLILQQEIYVCPSCETSLCLKNDELHIAEENIENNDTNLEELENGISSLSKKIVRLKNNITEKNIKLEKRKELEKEILEISEKYEDILSASEIRENIDTLSSYISSQKELERKISEYKLRLDTKQFSSSFSSFQNNLRSMKEKIKKLENSIDKKAEFEEEDLRIILETQRRNKEKYKILFQSVNKNKKELLKLEDEIRLLNKNFYEKYSLKLEDEIKAEIKNSEKEILKLEETLQNHENNLKAVERYENYRKEKEKYQEKIDRIENLKKDEEEKRKNYTAITLLKEKILLAESIAITNVIESINLHAQEYLDMFFPTDPISVTLLPFKESKKSTANTSKPQINLQIEYKGMEADISMLSGGELSRVVLAFTLALADIFNSPMLLLDECTASLDQELTGIVINGIRKNFGNRLVIVIAHQVVGGIFDRVIKL